ncbi:MAG: hypothetical protein ACNA7U_04725 [Candidatus Izemoplasmataceae bacterium]|jgi:thioredoxin-related protein|uniref:hypothetical protein n=1 Tax=Liberiplasma polymorphum TaxID=3374570 RepID=UPI003771D68C
MKKLLIIFTLVFLLASCKQKEEEIIYEYDDFYELTRWSDISMLEQGQWFIYVYSEFCYACEVIKQDILSFGDSIRTEAPFYVANHAIVEGLAPIDYRGTPTLFMMDNNEVITYFEGTSDILSFIATFQP